MWASVPEIAHPVEINLSHQVIELVLNHTGEESSAVNSTLCPCRSRASTRSLA